MDDRLYAALAAIDPDLAAHYAERSGTLDEAEAGAIDHLAKEHAALVRRLRVAVWADVLRGGAR